jgi:hypothetical protein
MSGVDGEAAHEGHQTASALVVVPAGDVPTGLMTARVARAAGALSVSSAVIVASAGTTTTSTAGSSLRCVVIGTVRPAPVVTVRPVPVTSTRIAGIAGPAPGRSALRRREDADERGQPGAEASVPGQQPSMRDANGSKPVVCATGPAGRALVGSWWRPAPGWPEAVAAPRGWQACGGGCRGGRPHGTAVPAGLDVLQRPAPVPATLTRAAARSSGPGSPRRPASRRAGPEILQIAIEPARRRCALGAVVLTSMRSRPSPAACRTISPAMSPAPGCLPRSAAGRRA